MARLLISFTGNNGPGTLSVNGAKAGDQVLAVISSSGANASTWFSPIIISDDEIKQTGQDYSSSTMYVLLDRDLLI